MQTNPHSGTRIDEIGDRMFRINTPVEIPGGAFSFNQYLVADHAPLLFHTGGRRLFRFVREAVAAVIDPATVRYVAFSHVESDECGSLNEWLAAAPRTAGRPATYSRRRRGPCSVATCSRSLAAAMTRSPRATSWVRARRSAPRSTTTPPPRTFPR